MRRSRRGISTLVGAVFFIAVVMGAMLAVSWTFQQQSSFSTTAAEVTKVQLERSTSNLKVRDVRIDNDKFNITLRNDGPLTEKIERIWITNETSNWHKSYDTDYMINPRETISAVGQDIGELFVDEISSYQLKFVTERGNLYSFRTLSVADANLGLSMIVAPPTINRGENVTVILSVKNKESEVDSVHNIVPVLNVTNTCSGSDCPPILTELSAPSPLESLSSGSTEFFKWVYNIDGPTNATITFTGSLDGNPNNSGSETVEIVPVVADKISVTSIITSNAGSVTMDFSTFQHCKPSDPGDGCVPSGDGWKPGWKVDVSEEYLWRINVTNHGPKSILLDKYSSVLLLHVQDQAGGNIPTDAYILKDPTDNPVDEDGSAYNPNYFKVLQRPINGDPQAVMLYFGADKVGESALQDIKTDGLYAVNLVLFGFIDENDNGEYNQSIDTEPYSQNLPFQGICASCT